MSGAHPSAALGAEALESAYHEARVLLLAVAVSAQADHQRKLDGLTKLAKLDFLVRYPALAPVVLPELNPDDARLHLSAADRLDPTAVEAPMIRYKYGPWDDRYYPVIGALVGKGLLRYTRGRQGSVALSATAHGKAVAADLAVAAEWAAVADRCAAVAAASGGLTGNALKERIYSGLAELMDRPYRQLIR